MSEDTQKWYCLHPTDSRDGAADLAKELIEHEDGAIFRDTGKHMFLYTKTSWDELSEEFDEVAMVGLDYTEGMSKAI